MTPIQFIEEKLQGMINNGADLGDDLPTLKKHIEYAKLIERQNNFVLDETINVIRVETGRSRNDSIQLLYLLRNEIGELCKDYNKKHGKKF
jgi:hypothetical protein